MTQPGPPPFTVPQQEIINSYTRLRTLVAGPPPTPPGGTDIPTRPPGPTISQLEPNEGFAGYPVLISGTDLIRISETGRDSPINVFFGTKPAQFEFVESKVRAFVPQNAPPGAVRVAVETDCGTALSAGLFTVKSQVIG